MSKDFEQDIINIDLQNLSSLDSEIDLFSYESNDVNSTTQTLYTSLINNIDGESVKVTYTENGVSDFEIIIASNNNVFVTNANSFFSGIFNFYYEYYSPTQSIMFVELLNTNYQLIKLGF